MQILQWRPTDERASMDSTKKKDPESEALLPRNSGSLHLQSRELLLLGLDLEILCVVAGLERVFLRLCLLERELIHRLMPVAHDQLHSGGNVLDLVAAVSLRDRIVRMIENGNFGGHPLMDVAVDAEQILAAEFRIIARLGGYIQLLLRIDDLVHAGIQQLIALPGSIVINRSRVSDLKRLARFLLLLRFWIIIAWVDGDNVRLELAERLVDLRLLFVLAIPEISRNIKVFSLWRSQPDNNVGNAVVGADDPCLILGITLEAVGLILALHLLHPWSQVRAGGTRAVVSNLPLERARVLHFDGRRLASGGATGG